jgi:two-component system chemotaxis response regulator CheB
MVRRGKSTSRRIDAVVIGTSSGGFPLLEAIFAGLPVDFGVPVLVVQHLHPTQDSSPASLFNQRAEVTIKEAEDKELIVAGTVYFAPPNYHLLVEPEMRVTLSADEKVLWSRPSVDMLFESAAFVWAPRLLGVLLSGANEDGASGTAWLHRHGCLTFAQDPLEAASPEMPRAAIRNNSVDRVLGIAEIARQVCELGGRK